MTLLPLVFALLHAFGWVRIDVLLRLDDIIYDARLRATMPQTLDERIVIVDLDEKSLSEVGRWPWGRDKLAKLTDELFERQKIALLGFDVVHAEADESSGLKHLERLAAGELRGQTSFVARLSELRPSLDNDGKFAEALRSRPVVLGYYLTHDEKGRSAGVMPQPVMPQDAMDARRVPITSWNSFGANIETLARAAPMAGFFNSIPDRDGVVRTLPLLAEYKGNYYESLALAMFRMLTGLPAVKPVFPAADSMAQGYQGIDGVLLQKGASSLTIPVDERVSVLVPFRGPGGPAAGSFRYVSASDVMAGRLAPGTLKDRIVLVGTTAPGLLDLRVTPVSEVYPGVEAHANLISGLLDGRILVKPDYAAGYEVVIVVLVGLLLALALPVLSAPLAVALSLVALLTIIGLNFWLYQSYGLVLPLASGLTMTGLAFALNMSYGYFVESRSKRELAQLFGVYVPPQLVSEMVKSPDNYSMKAVNKELTVMFCDMRGFTRLSERMEPLALQQLLNNLFSQLTQIISANRGTIDKYMGDCVMAFWGAPVDMADHARLAVKTALDMSHALGAINATHRGRGLPEIGLGIGVNTGIMCVGDMGSDIRRSYTVIGDAVNLGSRLEGLSKVYGVTMVVSESTRRQVPEYVWQELDRVRVKGKDQAVSIYWPVAPIGQLTPTQEQELASWTAFLDAYRAQNWAQCDILMLELTGMDADKPLYQLYASRLYSKRQQPFDPAWDGASNFETK